MRWASTCSTMRCRRGACLLSLESRSQSGLATHQMLLGPGSPTRVESPLGQQRTSPQESLRPTLELHMIVERQHEEAPHFRYDQHLFVKMADGRVFQTGPYKDIEFGHHHDRVN